MMTVESMRVTIFDDYELTFGQIDYYAFMISVRKCI